MSILTAAPWAGRASSREELTCERGSLTSTGGITGPACADALRHGVSGTWRTWKPVRGSLNLSYLDPPCQAQHPLEPSSPGTGLPSSFCPPKATS